MEITVDGKKHMLLQANPETLGVALLEINDFLQTNGRALQSIIADGQNVSPEEITGAFAQTPTADVASLEITTADLQQLVLESITELTEVVPELPFACQELAGILASDQPQEGMPGLGQLLEIWTALKQRQAQIMESLTLDITILEVAGVPITEHEQKLWDLIESVRTAMEPPDFVKLADLLSYDLALFAEREADIVALLKDKS